MDVGESTDQAVQHGVSLPLSYEEYTALHVDSPTSPSDPDKVWLGPEGDDVPVDLDLPEGEDVNTAPCWYTTRQPAGRVMPGSIVRAHKRFCHLNFESLRQTIIRPNFVSGLNIPVSAAVAAKSWCDECSQAKTTRAHLPPSSSRADKPLALIHVDLCGPFPTPGLNGELYSQLILCDKTAWGSITVHRTKDEAGQALIATLRRLERASGHPVKILRSDNGGEYTAGVVADFCADAGILHQYTVPYTSAQNGRVERLHRTVQDRARAVLLESGLPLFLWPQVFQAVVYTRNRAYVSTASVTPYEGMYGKPPQVKHLRILGSKAFVWLPEKLRIPKLGPRAVVRYLVGYSETVKGYVLYDPDTQALSTSCHVRIHEGTLYKHHTHSPSQLLQPSLSPTHQPAAPISNPTIPSRTVTTDSTAPLSSWDVFANMSLYSDSREEVSAAFQDLPRSFGQVTSPPVLDPPLVSRNA